MGHNRVQKEHERNMQSKDKIKYKRYAFISYSHKDVKEAKWLHKHLEYYKLPNDIFNEYDETTRYLRPIFRDKEDIGTGVLKSELRKELEVSKYLIIICSPNSVQSIYVSQEVNFCINFWTMGQKAIVILLLIII